MTTAPHQQFAAVTAPADAELQLLDAYWRTANYLAVGMIYLQDNPLLREPLQGQIAMTMTHLHLKVPLRSMVPFIACEMKMEMG